MHKLIRSKLTLIFSVSLLSLGSLTVVGGDNIFASSQNEHISDSEILSEPDTATESSEPNSSNDSDVSDSDVSEETPSDSQPVKNGWYGKKYFKNDVPVTGLTKIRNCYFYFSNNGIVQSGWKTIQNKRYYFCESGGTGKYGHSYSGWKTINKKKFYFNKKGYCTTGIKKVNKKWYFFNKKGVLKTSTTKENGTSYYIYGKKLEAYSNKNGFYKPNGKKLSTTASENYQTLLRARKVVDKITTSDMSQSQKLLECFRWVQKSPYITYRKFNVHTNWIATYANDHFQRRGGDCHANAAAFAYLAYAIGYDKVYVCLDCNGERAQGHSWTEINGKAYDPLFAEVHGMGSNYGAKYGVYKESPILHIKLKPIP